MTLVTQKKRSPSVHEQKRYGQHRQHSKPYLKTYWPYLPLFMVAAFVIVFAGARIFGAPGAVVGSLGVTIAGASLLI